MKTTTVDKQKLLETLEANRETHAAQYKEARKKWKKFVLERYESIAEVLADGGTYEHIEYPLHDLVKPQSYVKHYDTAIAQLEWEEADTVQLDQNEFNQYVLNDWAWKNQVTSNSIYAGTITSGSIRA